MGLPPVNNTSRTSICVTEEANELIKTHLPKGCEPLCMAMVKRYSYEEQEAECSLREIGALCFVKDEIRGYYFQLFCPVRKLMIWEHRVSPTMDYKAETSRYHSFSCRQNKKIKTGFKFSSEKESEAFLKEVLKILYELKDNEIQQKQIEGVRILSKRPISKSDIGVPYNFKKVGGFSENINNRHSDSSFNRLKSIYQKVPNTSISMTDIPDSPSSSKGPEKNVKSNVSQLKSLYQNVPPPPRVTEKNFEENSTEIKRTKSLQQNVYSRPRVMARNSISDIRALDEFKTENQDDSSPLQNATTPVKSLPSVPVRKSSLSPSTEITKNKREHHNPSRTLEEANESSHQNNGTPPKAHPRVLSNDLESNLGPLNRDECFKITWDSQHGTIDFGDKDAYRRIKEYFLKAGLPENHLLESGIRQFIEHFLITNIKKFIKEMEGSIGEQEQVPPEKLKTNKPKINVDNELDEVAEYKEYSTEFNLIEHITDSSDSSSNDDSVSDDEIITDRKPELIHTSKKLNEESNNINIEKDDTEELTLKQGDQSLLKSYEIENPESVEVPIMPFQSVNKSKEVTSKSSTVHIQKRKSIPYNEASKSNFYTGNWVRNQQEIRLASSSNSSLNSTFYDTDITRYPKNSQIKQSQSMSSIAEAGVTESHNEIKTTYQETKSSGSSFASHQRVHFRGLTRLFQGRGNSPKKEVFPPDDPVLLKTRGENINYSIEDSSPPPLFSKVMKNKRKAPPPPPK